MAAAFLNTPLFASLGQKDFERVIALIRRRSYSRGSVVEPLPWAEYSVFAVERGRVRITLAGPEGKEYDLPHRRPGALFTLRGSGGTGAVQRVAYALRDDTVLSVLPGEAAVELLVNHRKNLVSAFQAILAYLEEREERIYELAYSTVRERLGHMLRTMARADPEGAARVTQEELARLVGTTRERISAELPRLREDGLVDYRSSDREHRIFLRDPNGLASR
jgi:CRP-like cAMP-binding protein